MSMAIFNRYGEPVGWLDGDVVRDPSGRHRAFVRNGNLFTYSAVHLGTFQDGYFRDRSGHAVAFIDGATGGALPPVPQMPPVPPIFPVAPVAPVPPIPPIAPIASLSWSNLDWMTYLLEDR